MTNRLQIIEQVIKNMSDEKFNELLNDLGVKEEQWEPEYGEHYYIVSHDGDILGAFWNNDTCDNHLLLMNNVFKSREEAIVQRDFNIEKAKLIKEIEDSSDVIDWGNRSQIKYSLNYNHYENKVVIRERAYIQSENTAYTTNEEFLENLIKNEPERIKKYLFEVK